MVPVFLLQASVFTVFITVPLLVNVSCGAVTHLHLNLANFSSFCSNGIEMRISPGESRTDGCSGSGGKKL